MTHYNHIKEAVSSIADGAYLEDQIAKLLESSHAQGWWPSGTQTRLGQPLSSDFWMPLVKSLIKLRGRGKSAYQILRDSAKEHRIPVELLTKFLDATKLLDSFRDGTITPEQAAKAFEGSEQGKGIWSKGTSQNMSGRYKFDKSLGDD